jgi:hypothetical protein
MKSIKQQLCEYLCKKPEPERPFTTIRLRSSLRVWDRLTREFPSAVVKIRDRSLTAPSKNEFQAWLTNDIGNHTKYQKDWYDCDDYAMDIRYKMFKLGHEYKTTFTVAYCEGHTESGYHAYNLLTDNKDAIYIIEPQTDRLMLPSECNYRTEFIHI